MNQTPSNKAPFTRGDVKVTWPQPFVAQCTINRPPNNFFDVQLLQDIASIYADMNDEAQCRVIILCSEGNHFCAGANFDGGRNSLEGDEETGNPLYKEAVKIFAGEKPVIAVIQGAAVGGGLGLALSADFRVGCTATRMVANFVKLGFIPGFGISYTLPKLIGQQAAADMLMTGRRVKGDEAYKLGLLDHYVEPETLMEKALDLAASIAENAPLAVVAVRKYARGDLPKIIQEVTDYEATEQFRLTQTLDHKEGILSYAEKRPAVFVGR